MKTRIISAIVALVVVIPLYIIGDIPLAIFVGIIGLLGYKEILTLKESHKPLPALVIGLGALSLLSLIFVTLDGYQLAFGVSYQAIMFLVLAMLIPTLFYKDDTAYTTKDAFYLVGTILVLGVTFNAFLLLRERDILLLVYLFLISSMNDTFAMIVGKLIGKHKLCPKISPNKTIEGSLAGLILGTFMACLFYYNLIQPLMISKLIIMTVFLSVVGQIGDILFSKIKRENNIKDFSNIMPGHGGILDRLDSICFIILAFILIIRYI